MLVSKSHLDNETKLTEVDKDSESSPRRSNVVPSNLLVVQEVPDVLVSDDVSDVGPAKVNPREDSEAEDMGVDRLWRISTRVMIGRKETYNLAADAAEKEDFNEGNDTTDSPLVEDIELDEPVIIREDLLV